MLFQHDAETTSSQLIVFDVGTPVVDLLHEEKHIKNTLIRSVRLDSSLDLSDRHKEK